MKTSMRFLLAGGATAALVLTSVQAAGASATAVGAPSGAASGPVASASTAAYPKYKAPKTFGTSFQPDPTHDFTKGIHTRHNGILRGWITHLRGGVAEYEPIKFKTGTRTEGHFVGPREGDVMAYASRLSPRLTYLSATGCKPAGTVLTTDRKSSVGVKRCPRSILAKRLERPALITVHGGQIVKVQEIFTP
ncbi:hypothetical protein [Nonomuraea lactucae]|uniref:hypothetical protein n=1 Tax=Nonomuraea lactucae TaxID=2249762 RepID=UPI001F05F2C9|nr:hypothetical protein [Nonomuraea lactucae]